MGIAFMCGWFGAVPCAVLFEQLRAHCTVTASLTPHVSVKLGTAVVGVSIPFFWQPRLETCVRRTERAGATACIRAVASSRHPPFHREDLSPHLCCVLLPLCVPTEDCKPRLAMLV